jgi:hypothetical protein
VLYTSNSLNGGKGEKKINFHTLNEKRRCCYVARLCIKVTVKCVVESNKKAFLTFLTVLISRATILKKTKFFHPQKCLRQDGKIKQYKQNMNV